MVQRTKRSEIIPQADDLLAVIGGCRDRLIAAQTRVRAFGPAYHAMSMVTAAIDALATYITGQRHYFEVEGSIAPAGTRNMVVQRPDHADDADEPE